LAGCCKWSGNSKKLNKTHVNVWAFEYLKNLCMDM
jgi:hypothetical protein